MIPVLHDLLVAIASLRFLAGAFAQSPAPASVDRRIVASQATLTDTIARRRGMQSRVITFRQRGFPSGISLDRVTAQRQIAFHLPVSARVSRGHLELLVRFSPEVLPQSNLEVSVNGVLLAVMLRSDNGATTGKGVRVNLPADVLRGGWLVITMRAAVATTPDACLDERKTMLQKTFRRYDCGQWVFL